MTRDREVPQKRSRLRWPGLVLGLVALVVVVHYWPGRGTLHYFGIHTRHPAFDFSGPSRLPLAQPRNDVTGVANFAQISPQLYRGAQPTAEGFGQLKRLGIKTITSLRETHSDRGAMKGLGLRYAHIRFNPTRPEDHEVAEFLQVMRDPANQPAFVHCLAGSDRTGTMVAIYRVVQQGWPMQEAVKELPRFGYHEVWTHLIRYLADFDRARIERLVATQPPPKVEVVF